jgi:5-methylcytosine-specific restriction endonuclease McrA
MADKKHRRIIAYKKTVKWLMREQAGICHLCGAPMDENTLVTPYHMHATVDHVTPLGQGGANEPSNYRLAHRACNRIKGHLLISGIPMNVRQRPSVRL